MQGEDCPPEKVGSAHPTPVPARRRCHLLHAMTDNPETKLIVYGSLAPGEVNDFMLAGLAGEWHPCRIRGRMGTFLGFKSFRYDPQGPEHPAWLLVSADLPRIIPELDDFEGEAYERRIIPARVNGGWVRAQVYEGRYVD
jgi:gamma-glutamylcyclotransferase (GGCT)/AIG2-like uncharacterized protein YtfP